MTAAAMNGSLVPELNDFFQKRQSDDPLERKEVEDFKDRAAYVYITGSFPTHLRRYFVGLLRKATNFASAPSSLDRQSGSVMLKPEVIQEADLQNHPMVKKVREYVREGYRIQKSRGVAERRPYSRVFIYKNSNMGAVRLTVKSDGSVREGWH